MYVLLKAKNTDSIVELYQPIIRRNNGIEWNEWLINFMISYVTNKYSWDTFFYADTYLDLG